MPTCAVRWRSSGGRGEYEYVPAGSLDGRDIYIAIDALGITIPAEVRGVSAQGKPRLRKFNKNDRKKLHLPPLVIAAARFPQPRREDITHAVTFPLENKGYVLDEMIFDILDDTQEGRVVLSPLKFKILNSDFTIDLQDRFKAIARDVDGIDLIQDGQPDLAAAILGHAAELIKGINSIAIAESTDEVIIRQGVSFGVSNFGSITVLREATAKPLTETEEDIYGVEGQTLVRVHVYKERDRNLVLLAKKFYKQKWGGSLHCEACGLKPIALYGVNGERCIEAHHKTPIEQLLPDSITRVNDLAMLCASCHRVVHATKPCLGVDQVVTHAA